LERTTFCGIIAFHFPKNVEILSVPKDAHLANASGRHNSTYRREGDAVTVHRSFRDQTPGPVRTPADDREFRIHPRHILRDLRAQVLYQ